MRNRDPSWFGACPPAARKRIRFRDCPDLVPDTSPTAYVDDFDGEPVKDDEPVDPNFTTLADLLRPSPM